MSAPEIKLIATDFDGTLHSDAEFPPVPADLQQLLANFQAAGGKWIINTGRDLPGILEAVARAHLSVKPDGLGLVEREVYLHDGSRYIGVAEWNDACLHDQSAVFAAVRPDLPELYAWISQRYEATVYEDPYSPFCVIADNNGDADAIVAFLEAYCRRVPNLTVVRNDVYSRFSHSDYNKGTVLEFIAQHFGIGPESVLAAGDHFNDLPMLERARAHWLVAPGNAVSAVKAAVLQQGGYVSGRPAGHGVADGLRRFLKSV